MMTTGPAPAARATPVEARARFRTGAAVPTTGWCDGWTQANLVVLPLDWAYDRLLFGQRNPQPVPLLDVTEPGSRSTELAPDTDLTTDLPRYRVWRDGELVDEPTDVEGLWRDDLVSFLIGCSFSFETALLEAGCRCVTWSRVATSRCSVRPTAAVRRGDCGETWSSRCGRSRRARS